MASSEIEQDVYSSYGDYPTYGSQTAANEDSHTSVFTLRKMKWAKVTSFAKREAAKRTAGGDSVSDDIDELGDIAPPAAPSISKAVHVAGSQKSQRKDAKERKTLLTQRRIDLITTYRRLGAMLKVSTKK